MTPRMTDEIRAQIDRSLRKLVGGSQLRVVYEGHRFLVMITNEEGFHTGRARYLVACITCEKLLHEATTGPIENIDRHIRELEREKP